MPRQNFEGAASSLSRYLVGSKLKPSPKSLALLPSQALLLKDTANVTAKFITLAVLRM